MENIEIACRIQDGKIWHEKPDVLKLYLYLLFNARKNETPEIYNGFTINQGEFVRSLRDIAEDNKYTFQNKLCCWASSTVKDMLRKLAENTDETGNPDPLIEILDTSHGMHIRVIGLEDKKPVKPETVEPEMVIAPIEQKEASINACPKCDTELIEKQFDTGFKFNQKFLFCEKCDKYFDLKKKPVLSRYIPDSPFYSDAIKVTNDFIDRVNEKDPVKGRALRNGAYQSSLYSMIDLMSIEKVNPQKILEVNEYIFKRKEDGTYLNFWNASIIGTPASYRRKSRAGENIHFIRALEKMEMTEPKKNKTIQPSARAEEYRKERLKATR